MKNRFNKLNIFFIYLKATLKFNYNYYGFKVKISSATLIKQVAKSPVFQKQQQHYQNTISILEVGNVPTYLPTYLSSREVDCVLK